MPQRQRDQGAQAVLETRLQGGLLPSDSVRTQLASMSPDTAAQLLSGCVLTERRQRRAKERRTLLICGLGFLFWLQFNVMTGILQETGFWLFLIGPALVLLAIWVASCQPGALRHNALTGLGWVIEEVRDTATLEPLVHLAGTLDSRRRPWEADLETAVCSTLARLLTRLSAEEATALSEDTRDGLRRAVQQCRHATYSSAALLTLGSAGDARARPLAEAVLGSTNDECLQEAANECLGARN